MSSLTIGTRGSDLALAQARQVAARLTDAGVASEIVTITTSGDRRGISRDPGDIGKALWTREIEDALSGGDVDLAVHSLKDLPADLPSGLVIGAVLPREDPSDVLVSRDAPRTPDRLPPRARVGTGSVRRAACLLRARPDLDVRPLKGNVPTRIRRLEEERFDAIVLAAAGLNRLGLRPVGLCVIGHDVMPPALCQGIVAVEVREDDAAQPWVRALSDRRTMAVTRAERALLAALDVGCGAPVGGLAVVQGGSIRLFGEVLSADGGRSARESTRGPVEEADVLGRRLGAKLLEESASALMAELRRGSARQG